MGLTFFDANVAVGRPQRCQLSEPLASPAELDAYLADTGITGALIWHWAQKDIHPESANPQLSAYAADSRPVRIAWAVLPPATGEQPDLLQRVQEANVAAIRLFPEQHRYVMHRVVWRDLLDEVAERAIPVMLSLEHGASWDQVYALLEAFPTLTCILCDIGTWSMDRYTYPLLEAYPNVYLETGMLSIEDGGVEGVADRFGAHRLVFGTGFPTRYAEAAMLQLTHADLNDTDKQAIASGNLQRLIEGAV